MKTRPVADEVSKEFAAVALGDERLNERLKRIVALVAAAPDDSFPELMQTVADREALYRFLSNPKVTLDAVLKGHVQQTHERLRHQQLVRIVHDTTKFRFIGERAGLGAIRGEAQGFFGHFALAVAANETRELYGVLGVRPFIHEQTEARRKMTQRERVAATQAKPREEKESSRWERLAIDVSNCLPAGVRPLHVMDQEADDFDLFAELHRAQLAFVVRANPERRSGAERLPAKDVLSTEPAEIFRTVSLSPRDPRAGIVRRKRRPARIEREAKLRIRWAPITLVRGPYNDAEVRDLSLYAVHVFEPKPPQGEEAIEWMLFTSEPVGSLDEATSVVDHYRARWVIEEYFKALKTGCAFEKRQLMTFEGLVRALALFVPMAWRLLVLRQLGRESQPRPARRVLNEEELTLLRALLAKRNQSLPAHPNVRDAMFAIAALGGHIKNNGDPGWLVLGRGLTRFLEAAEGWMLARAAM